MMLKKVLKKIASRTHDCFEAWAELLIKYRKINFIINISMTHLTELHIRDRQTDRSIRHRGKSYESDRISEM